MSFENGDVKFHEYCNVISLTLLNIINPKLKVFTCISRREFNKYIEYRGSNPIKANQKRLIKRGFPIALTSQLKNWFNGITIDTTYNQIKFSTFEGTLSLKHVFKPLSCLVKFNRNIG